MSNSASFQLSTSRHFAGWLIENKLSLAFTTYQAGRLFLLGVNANGQLSAFERAFDRCMGLWSDGQSLWFSSLYQIWQTENILPQGELAEGYDRLYVPRIGYVTGDVDVHDVAVGADGRPIFVCTLFSCLATVADRFSFTPLWKPAFISRLAPEDRCHLNGLAMRDGKPRYVTACSQSDVVESWRAHRSSGGCVVDVANDELVCDGLSMPHSPRWHDDRLWLLNSGTGFLGYIDEKSGNFEPTTFCPGYARGLALVGHYAVVGVSTCRQEREFADLALENNLNARGAVASCGLLVVNLKTGNVEHWARIEGVVQELYDVAALDGVVRPKALGFKTDEIGRTIWLNNNGSPTRWRAAAAEEPEPKRL